MQLMRRHRPAKLKSLQEILQPSVGWQAVWQPRVKRQSLQLRNWQICLDGSCSCWP